MARDFSSDERTLINSAEVRKRLLVTFHLDDGDYRFCDDVMDMVDGDGNTYVGASALFQATEVKSGTGFAAEPLTLTLDGTRLLASGFSDPADIFREAITVLKVNRRVDFAFGFSYPNVEIIQVVVPVFAGKINNTKITDPQMSNPLSHNTSSTISPGSLLSITLDSLAIRYSWITGRVRTHQDQLEIDATDMFFSFVADNLIGETSLYWGKADPNRKQPIFGISVQNFVKGGPTH